MKKINFKSKLSLSIIGLLSLVVVSIIAWAIFERMHHRGSYGLHDRGGHGWYKNDHHGKNGDGRHGGYGKGGNDRDRHGWNEGRIAKKLGLNAEQEQQLEVLLAEIKDQAGEMRDNRKNWLEGLGAEFEKDNFDSSWFENRIQQQQQAHTELYMLVGKNLAEFHNVLNAEQRTKFADQLERFESRSWRY